MASRQPCPVPCLHSLVVVEVAVERAPLRSKAVCKPDPGSKIHGSSLTRLAPRAGDQGDRGGHSLSSLGGTSGRRTPKRGYRSAPIHLLRGATAREGPVPTAQPLVVAQRIPQAARAAAPKRRAQPVFTRSKTARFSVHVERPRSVGDPHLSAAATATCRKGRSSGRGRPLRGQASCGGTAMITPSARGRRRSRLPHRGGPPLTHAVGCGATTASHAGRGDMHPSLQHEEPSVRRVTSQLRRGPSAASSSRRSNRRTRPQVLVRGVKSVPHRRNVA